MFHLGYKLNWQLVMVAFSFLLLSWGCKKESFDTTIGFVVDTGSFNSGGCSWMIEVPTVPITTLEPVNLPPAYLQDGLPVRIEYLVLDQTPICTTLMSTQARINIHKIEIIQ